MDFNEKLQWLKLYWNEPLVSICADKYEVHNYVEELGCGEIMNRLIGVYNAVDEIDWEALPERFVMKCTHGCGYNIIVPDKSRLDKEQAERKLDDWMHERFGRKSLEYHYDRIRPRIIIEEFIEGADGMLPLDYKVYCFNGEAKLVQVCSERDTELREDFLDLEWQSLDIGCRKTSAFPLARPDCFDQMIHYAQRLAKPFPFVRVDFYDRNGSPVLGEMTFTPGSNMSTRYYNKKGLAYLGGLLELPSQPSLEEGRKRHTVGAFLGRLFQLH
ncbi:MAG: ATP-grasp fold amidoligase family protein [Pseudomonadota bacterium]